MKVGEGVGGNGGFRRPSCRLLENGVGESAENGEEETDHCGGRGVPQVHHPFREAHLRVGRRAAAEVGAFDEARARLSRLVEQAAVPKVVSEPVQEVVPPPEWAAEVQRLRDELERLRAGPACRSCGVRSHQSTRRGRVVVRETHRTLRCDRVWGQGVNFGADGFDPARGSPVSQFAVHSGQHGCVRIVTHQCGWKGCRVGEAINSGPRQSQEHVSDELLDALERDPVVGREFDVEEADFRARDSHSRDDEFQATQVHWGESVSFDMTVADSPDEGGTVAQFWDPRGRRVERSAHQPQNQGL